MDEPKELTQALAEQIVRATLGFTDSEEDAFMWKWQLRTVEVTRLIAGIKGILDRYEIKPKESTNA